MKKLFVRLSAGRPAHPPPARSMQNFVALACLLLSGLQARA